MTIETRFKVGDLVKHKYSIATAETKKEGLCIAMSILYIRTETCSAGTQVFYLCRSLFQHRKYDMMLKDNDLVEIGVGGFPPEQNKFREDELVPCPEDIIKIITNGL